jgi:hypothetical protein
MLFKIVLVRIMCVDIDVRGYKYIYTYINVVRVGVDIHINCCEMDVVEVEERKRVPSSGHGSFTIQKERC